MVTRVCDLTSEEFEISPEEIEIYKHFAMPLPTMCPEERYRILLTFCGGMRFYRRTCHLTGQTIFSHYPASTDIPVVSIDAWKDSSFNPLSFGFDFDFKKDFFEQLKTLWRAVPCPASSVRDVTEVRGVQSVYDVRDSFLVFDAHHVEQCAYSAGLWNCRRVVDCLNVYYCQNCYECIDCHNSSMLRWASHCINCEDSYFLANCSNCSECLFCTNLDGKKHYVFNQQVTPKEYRRLKEEWLFISRSKVEEGKERFSQLLQEHPVPHIVTDSLDQNTGNYLWCCRGAKNSFESLESNNIFNCRNLVRASHCIDGIGYGDGLTEAVQFLSVGNSAHNVMNCIDCGSNVSHLRYCSHCEESAHLLACVGLKGKEYCIFNKQYSASEYAVKYEQIKQHLQKKQLWGSFFKLDFSPFPYNSSLAGEKMPLSRVQAKLLGFAWDEEAERDVVPSEIIAESEMAPGERFGEVPEILLQLDKSAARCEMYICELTGKPFQFSVQEIAIYEHLEVALPARCFEQRHRERIMQLASGRLSSRDADGQSVKTAFPSDWSRKVVPHNTWQALVADNSKS